MRSLAGHLNSQSGWRRYWVSQSGAAAAEFALVLLLLTLPVLNVIDIGLYVFKRMELDNAAQVAVQAAWATCAINGYVPATVNSNCPNLSSAMSTALRSTALGTDVSITSTSEQYCCPGTTSPSCQGSVATTTPSACSSGDKPGDYIFITASYSYAPLFPDVSVASLLTTPIIRQAWMRLS